MRTRKTFTAAIVFLSAVLVLGICAFAGAGHAETGATASSAASQEGAAQERRVKIETESAGWALEEKMSAAAIKGAPFSAQTSVETTQTLANGSHIAQKQTGAIYRDSEGRVRRELPRAGEPEIALINDPTASVIYRLHLFQHTAMKVSLGAGGRTENSEVLAKLKAERRATNREPTPGQLSEDKQLGRLRKTESLGSQMIESVQAEGTRVTLTIAAGAQGNDQPLDIVSETWYSPELQMVVMTRRSDPRSGDMVYKLTNINRSEPPHTLFEPPAGFTVTEAMK